MKKFIFLLLIVLATTIFAYSPGLSGPFLFDDYPNLEPIGALGPITTLEQAWVYVTGGFAGPTGRPISLATFLIDARDWPADPYIFKRNNLIIHLMIAVVLFITIINLLNSVSEDKHRTYKIALIATALWVLNPFFVSTTMYPVQRMSQLATLFSIAGVLGYLYGRSKIQDSVISGHLIISIIVVLATLLAMFSKENGALLPLLILVIEFSFASKWINRGPEKAWIALFLMIPAISVVGYLAYRYINAPEKYIHRDFGSNERLMTQSRIIFDYLYGLLIPQISTRGLLQDNIVISKGVLQPVTTLISILSLVATLVISILVRKKWPLLTLATLFFLAAHILESTTIPLELYFEHRNYLPAIFLFLPIASVLSASYEVISKKFLWVSTLFLVVIFSFATWQRASIWGNEEQLMYTWAVKNPDSPRAQIVAAQAMIRSGKTHDALYLLDVAKANIEDSAVLTSTYLSFKASIGELESAELEHELGLLLDMRFDFQMLKAIQYLVDQIIKNNRLKENELIILAFLEKLNDKYGNRLKVVRNITLNLKADIYLATGDNGKAIEYYYKTIKAYNNIDFSLSVVAMLASKEHYKEAYDLLMVSEQMFEEQSDRTLKRSYSQYIYEIDRLEDFLLEDIDKKNRRFNPEEKNEKL